MKDFDELLTVYELATAQMKLMQAGMVPTSEGYDEWQVEFDRLVDAHTDAINAILLRPAFEPWEVAEKLRIVVDEEIHDGWYLATPILALLAEDARRVLPRKDAANG